MALSFFSSLGFVGYFYFNMDSIAKNRVDKFETISGIKYEEFKVDVPLEDEYRKEYVKTLIHKLD